MPQHLLRDQTQEYFAFDTKMNPWGLTIQLIIVHHNFIITSEQGTCPMQHKKSAFQVHNCKAATLQRL